MKTASWPKPVFLPLLVDVVKIIQSSLLMLERKVMGGLSWPLFTSM